MTAADERDVLAFGHTDQIGVRAIAEVAGLLESRESRLVGQLAEAVHRAGRRFCQWPEIERVWLSFYRDEAGVLRERVTDASAADLVRLHASVAAQVRP